MSLIKSSIYALSLVLSYDSFGATPVIRAGSLRLNNPVPQSTSSTPVTASTSSTGALTSYNRASSLRPSRVQVSGGKKDDTTEELLNKVYEEMEKVTNAVEQELYVTNKQIKDLKDEIAERDEKIKELEASLDEYDDIKQTVKDLPMLYYSKKEVDAKGYVMPSTLSAAIETAKLVVKNEALAEVERKGFITSSAVANEIADAKDAAVRDAVKRIENLDFATEDSLSAAEARLSNALKDTKASITNERNLALQLYAKSADVTSEISLAKNSAITDAKTLTMAAVENKNYATKQFVNDELSNVEVGIDENAVTTIVDARLRNKKVVQEDTLANVQAFKSVKDTVDAIPNNYYNKSKVDQKIAEAATGGEIDLSGYLAKDELIGALKKISDTEICLTKNCVSGQVADGLSGLEFGVDEDTVGGIIENKLPTIKAFKDVKDIVDAIPDNYYNMSTVDEKIAEAATGGEIDLSGYLRTSEFTAENVTKLLNGRFMTSSDTVELLKDYATKTELGKYVLKEGLQSVIEDIKTSDGKQLFITRNNVDEAIDKESLAAALLQDESFKAELGNAVVGDLEGLPTDVATLKTGVANLQAEDAKIYNKFDSYYTKTETESYVDSAVSAEKEARESAISDLSNIYATKTDLNGVNSKFDSYYTKTETESYVDSAVSAEREARTKAGYLTNSSLDGYATEGYVDTAVSAEREARTKAGYLTNSSLTSYATKDYVNTKVAEEATARNSELGKYVLETSLKEKITGITDETTGEALFITRNNVDEAIDKESLAAALLQDESFKAELGNAVVGDLEGLPTDVATLKGNVADLQAEDAKIYNKFDSYYTKTETDEAIDGAVDAEREARTKAGYLTNSSLTSYATKDYVDTAVSAEREARTKAGYLTENGLTQGMLTTKLGNAYVTSDVMTNAIAEAAEAAAETYATKTALNTVNSKFASYYTKAETDDAIEGAVAAEREARTKAGYLTDSSLTSYATKDYVDTEVGEEATARNSAIAAAKTEAINSAVAQAKTARDAALASYATTDAMNSAINAAKSAAITDAEGKIATAKDEAIAQAATAADEKYATKANLQNEVNTAIGKSETITSLQTDVETANSTAETAKSTAETAKSTAETAKSTAATAQSTAERAATAVQTLESKALTVENYCTNKPTECTDGGIGTDGK